MSKQQFVLVDGSSYFYRAFHALPPLSNSKGFPTGAIHGVINMIRRLVKDYEPEYIAIVFDAKGKTFRDDIYSDYKANRPPMPDDLSVQFEPLVEGIDGLGLPILMVDGVEADDVIGTLAKAAASKDIETIISTGDKDLAQLVTKKITLINTMNKTVLDEKGVEEKFGVVPDQIVDYLSLIGDKVDNVPGVEGVGPKTAVKWLNEYKSLDEIIKHRDDIKGKVGENLRASVDQLYLSKKLVTLKDDVKIPAQIEDLTQKSQNTDKLIKLTTELEMKTWLNELLGTKEKEEPTKNKADYETILDEKSLDNWIEKLKSAEIFSFDTETTSLLYMEAKIVGVSFSVKQNQAAYVPFGHDYEGAPKQLDKELVLSKLKPILESSQYKKVGQNIKYDQNVLASEGIHLKGVSFDTMLESYALNSSATRHDMDSLALKYLNRKTIHFEDVAGKGAKQVTFNKVPIEIASYYAAEDADITLLLHQTLWPMLSKIESVKRIFLSIEMPVYEVLSKMERTGVLIDSQKLLKQSATLAKRLVELEKEAFSLAGETFNLSSPKQLQMLFFEKLKLPIIKKTPKGQPSTAEPILQELALDYPLPKIILEYRSLSKLKSTYTDTLPLKISPTTGRVHTSYNQAVTATGRLSSTDPNLQNIPVKTPEGRQIRQAFIAPDGYTIVAADYSQIELRIMAHLSDDQSLRDAFKNEHDIHQFTAAEVFGVDIDKVTKEQRRHAKAINFGLIYGMSAFGLSKQIGQGRKAAQAYMDLYFERYPGVKRYMEEIREKAHRDGYVETLYGRRLYLPDINARNFMRKQAAERAAINAPMQGTAADIIKLAMIAVNEWLENENVPAQMIMQVHDELVFEVKNEFKDEFITKLPPYMCDCAHLSVPIKVDIGFGDNWDEAH